jgi:hypothetical protein
MHIERMGNEQLDDIAVLATVQRLQRRGMLCEPDERELRAKLKSPWGRTAIDAVLDTSKGDTPIHEVLRRFAANSR